MTLWTNQISAIFLLTLYSNPIGAQTATNPDSSFCRSHQGEVFNLKGQGKILEDEPVLDQDGSGICAAASSSLAFNAYLRRNSPESEKEASTSVWNLALKGAEYMAKNRPEEKRAQGTHTRVEYTSQGPMDLPTSAIIYSKCQTLNEFPEAKPTVIPIGENQDQAIVKCPTSKEVDLVYGLHICDIINEISDERSWCPLGNSPIEQSLFSSSGLSSQGQLLKALGQFFDKTYGNQGPVNPQEIVDDFAVMSQAMWAKAGEFCQLPVEEKIEKYHDLGVNHPIGDLSLRMQYLYADAKSKLSQAREPYREYFEKKAELEKSIMERDHGDHGYPIEGEIEFLKESLRRANSEQAREIYRSRLHQMQEKKIEIEQKITSLELWLEENSSKYSSLSEEYLKAKGDVVAFSPYLDIITDDPTDWDDENFLVLPQIDDAKIMKGLLSGSPFSSAKIFLGNRSLDHLLGWGTFQKQFEVAKSWTIPSQCKNIQYYLEMSDQGLEVLTYWSCIDQNLRDPYQKLARALGLIGGTGSSELISDFVEGITHYSPQNPEIDVHLFFGKVLAPQCLSQGEDLPASLQCDRVGVKTDEDMNPSKMSEEMIPYLNAEVPVVISVCSSFLSNPAVSNNKGQCLDGNAHGMTVTGFKCTDSGETEYLIQNSWGEDWCPENPRLQCIPGTGSFYVSEADLFSHTIEYYLVSSEEEGKAISKGIRKQQKNGALQLLIDPLKRDKKK